MLQIEYFYSLKVLTCKPLGCQEIKNELFKLNESLVLWLVQLTVTNKDSSLVTLLETTTTVFPIQVEHFPVRLTPIGWRDETALRCNWTGKPSTWIGKTVEPIVCMYMVSINRVWLFWTTTNYRGNFEAFIIRLLHVQWLWLLISLAYHK